MHVHDSLNKPHFGPQAADSTEFAASKGKLATTEGATGVVGESVTHAAAPEVIQLLNGLRELPEVREQVITEVTKRLAKGVYATRAAAEQTAGAIIEN